MEKRIAVFGLGFEGKWFVNEIGYENVEFIIDNNASMWGTIWNGIEVNSLEKFLEKAYGLEIVITTAKYKKEIMVQLQKAGYFKYNFYSEVWLKSKMNFWQNEKRLFLMNVHSYTNVGDYLITQAENLFLKEYFPDNEIIMIPSLICRDGMPLLKTYINPSDILLISGGGYLGNLWLDCGETNVRMIITNFLENKIIILSQTLFFTDDAEGAKELNNSRFFYNQHNNISICLRDKKSFELAQRIFDENIRCKYIPDMVLFMNKSHEVYDRDDVVLCFRTDKEGVISADYMNEIERFLRDNNIEFGKMSMETQDIVKTEDYDKAVDEKLDIVRKSRLVITDRLHCMLLCAITGTPCIAFDNVSGKVKGVYEWITHLSYIKFVETQRKMDKEILELLHINSQCYYDNTEVMKKFRGLAQMIKE